MNRIRKVSSLVLALALVLTGSLFTSSFAATTVSTTFYAHFAQIGQADSILLEQASKFILVDTGKESDSSTVTNMLSGRGVTKLQALVITHYDSDHVGAIDNVVNYLTAINNNTATGNITTVYARLYSLTQLQEIYDHADSIYVTYKTVYQNYIKFINAIIKISGSSITPLVTNASTSTVANTAAAVYNNTNGIWKSPNQANASFSFGNSTMRFKNTATSYITSTSVTDPDTLANQVNNDSLAFRIATTGTKASLLFLGDLHTDAIAQLYASRATYPINSDVLKLAHHGFQRSTSENLLDAVSPDYSIMTVADNDTAKLRINSIINRTTDNVIERDFGTKYYTGTSTNYGTISITSAGVITQTGLNGFSL